MWQLRKLSTNEALSEPGPLPNNWGPIFGLHGIQERLGDLSWLGPAYVDKGWVELTNEEQKALEIAVITNKIQTLKTETEERLKSPDLTVELKIALNEYLLALDSVCLCADFASNSKFPIKP